MQTDPSAILVTGGAGFIGSNFVCSRAGTDGETVVNLDKLTYAGNPANLDSLSGNPRHCFVHGDIGDRELFRSLLQKYRPHAVINFAAESHVDRSIHGPMDFIHTNILATFHMLECIREFWNSLDAAAKTSFRLLHVSTDEVYGSLEPGAPPFTENHPYQPNSPYSASKAGSDHLVRALHHTYGVPVLTTNCSNNYGPFQFPEKLVPLMIHNAISGKPLPVYGDGNQVRDWLYVADHCDAISLVLEKGIPGETYNIGGESERTNLDVVHTLCAILDELRPKPDGSPYASQIQFVTDRPGHDRRYAMDISKISRELGWKPRETFSSGIQKTVEWYLSHSEWVEQVVSGGYQNWIQKHYAGDRSV